MIRLRPIIRVTHRGRPCEDWDRDWSDVSTSQGPPRIAGCPQEWGEAPRAGIPSQPPGGTNPTNTSISNFWPPELWENKFLLLGAHQFVALCFGSLRRLTCRWCSALGLSAGYLGVFSLWQFFCALMNCARLPCIQYSNKKVKNIRVYTAKRYAWMKARKKPFLVLSDRKISLSVAASFMCFRRNRVEKWYKKMVKIEACRENGCNWEGFHHGRERPLFRG